MNSRERVLAVFDHKVPDRLPLDFGGLADTGISAAGYNRLKAAIGIQEERTRVLDLYMQSAKVGEMIRQRFHLDCALLHIEANAYRPWTLRDGTQAEVPAGWQPIQQADGSHVVMGPGGKPLVKRLPDSYTFSPCGPLCPGLTREEDIPKYMPVVRIMDRPPYIDETLEELAARAKSLCENSNYAIVGYFGGHVYAAATYLRGIENFMCDLVERPTFCRALMEAIADAHIREFDHYIKALGPWIQIVQVADDLGTQLGPQISPAMFREIVRPPMERLYRHIRGRTDCRLVLHSCGSVYRFIPDLIEMGVQGLNPVQISAAQMDPPTLKREFGKDIVFWGGGCDTQRVLPRGTPAEVAAEVRLRIDQLGKGGGMVFAQVHNIQPEVPPENIIAMLDTAYEYGAKIY
ncbi:MAG TPA: uroporphyrinogen decarboxylase family protein [Candidatus Brocadiia bacterium]|nr:uroporphyrinogen decarboxylase family protein [Candidatus Brocadiia bacterium]